MEDDTDESMPTVSKPIINLPNLPKRKIKKAKLKPKKNTVDSLLPQKKDMNTWVETVIFL